jgi:hypothetical protein
MAVLILVEVFWVVTMCSTVVGYQYFRGPCCLHIHNPEDLNFPLLFNKLFHLISQFCTCLVLFIPFMARHWSPISLDMASCSSPKLCLTLVKEILLLLLLLLLTWWYQKLKIPSIHTHVHVHWVFSPNTHMCMCVYWACYHGTNTYDLHYESI